MDYIKLSKILSYALRHHPEKYGITLDDEGWADLHELLPALDKSGFSNVTMADINFIIDSFEKKRHEIKGGKIRALYGHSVKKRIIKPVAIPPPVLYHGTSAGSLGSIMERGLLPMERQYVHLSAKPDTALVVAARRKGPVCLLEVMAPAAAQNGVLFYMEENNIWLSGPVPPQFIKISNEKI